MARQMTAPQRQGAVDHDDAQYIHGACRRHKSERRVYRHDRQHRWHRRMPRRKTALLGDLTGAGGLGGDGGTFRELVPNQYPAAVAPPGAVVSPHTSGTGRFRRRRRRRAVATVQRAATAATSAASIGRGCWRAERHRQQQRRRRLSASPAQPTPGGGTFVRWRNAWQRRRRPAWQTLLPLSTTCGHARSGHHFQQLGRRQRQPRRARDVGRLAQLSAQRGRCLTEQTCPHLDQHRHRAANGRGRHPRGAPADRVPVAVCATGRDDSVIDDGRQITIR